MTFAKCANLDTLSRVLAMRMQYTEDIIWHMLTLANLCLMSAYDILMNWLQIAYQHNGTSLNILFFHRRCAQAETQKTHT